jgi:hypothetical protein
MAERVTSVFGGHIARRLLLAAEADASYLRSVPLTTMSTKDLPRHADALR